MLGKTGIRWRKYNIRRRILSITTNSGTTVQNNITLSSGNTNFNHSNTATYSGVISGIGNLVKAGSGTVTLSGNNTFTGDTTINGGTLTLSGTLSDSTDVIVNSGTTYDINTTIPFSQSQEVER